MRTVGLTILTSLIAVSVFVFLTRDVPEDTQREYPNFVLPDSPLSASYVHGGADIQLENGSYESMQTIKGPVYGDINGDDADDATVLLKDGEGYYVALALKDGEGFLGLNTIPTGEMTPPSDMYIYDELLHLVYKNDGGEYTQYFTIVGATFEEIAIVGDVYEGTYIYEEEVRTFKPCNSDETYTISSESNSLAALEAIYTQRSYSSESLDGVYIVLAGSVSGVDESETGPGNFQVTGIIRAPEHGVCRQSASEEPIPDVSEQSR